MGDGVNWVKGEVDTPSISKENTTSEQQGTKGSGGGAGVDFYQGSESLKHGGIGSTGLPSGSPPSGTGEIKFAKGESSK